MIIYLGALLPVHSCGSLTYVSAALHAGKDLAVSPRMLPYELTHEGFPFLSIKTSLLAPRMLPWMGVTHYLSPDYSGRVRTFLPTKVRRSSCEYSMQYLCQFASYGATGSTTLSPTVISCVPTNPAVVSTTNHAGTGDAKDLGKVSGATVSSICTIVPSSAAHKISIA